VSIVDASGFVVALALTYLLGWSTRDLIWSFWVSSLVVGTAHIAAANFGPALGPGVPAAGRVLLFAFGLPGVAFFLFHFGFFHYIHAHILSLPFPPIDDPGRVYVGTLTWRNVRPFSFTETLAVGFSRYSPIALVALVREWPSIRAAAGRDRTERGTVDAAYRSVIRIHVVVLLSIAFFAVGVDSFATFVIVFAIYFAPRGSWGALAGVLRPRVPPNDAS